MQSINLREKQQVRQGRRHSRKLLSSAEGSSFSSLASIMFAATLLLTSHTTTLAFTNIPEVPSGTIRSRLLSASLAESSLAESLSSSSSSGQRLSRYSGEGLSRYYQSILSRTNNRQRFVTGKYPAIVSVQEDPTRKWLALGRGDTATTHVLVNGTSIDRSLASYDRLQWLDDDEREELHDRYASVSMELLAEIHMVKPGYVNILSSDGAGSSAAALRNADSTTRWNWNRKPALPDELEDSKWQSPYRERLWVTGFTLAGRKGIVKSMDVNNGHIDSVNKRSKTMALWPNEVNSVPTKLLGDQHASNNEYEDALLISDGFLVPGKDRGGIYIVKNPGNPTSEWTVCLTNMESSDPWFYHRAVWVDLTGDGRRSILTARAKLRKVHGKNGKEAIDSRPKNGQLVWLEMPKPHHIDEATGTPLEEDGTAFDPFAARHLPWKERVLAAGPDVMFNIADLDADDDTIEIIASQFFDRKVSLHSIQRCLKPHIVFSRVIDDRCGSAFGGILADLDCDRRLSSRRVIDSGSTVESLKQGDSFSHLLVTSHECNYVETNGEKSSSNNSRSYAVDGGSLFAYRVPNGKDAWKTEEWVRTTIATGFRVKSQIWNVINPGAPGFVYAFHSRKDDSFTGKRPMIAVAGDCAESAYIYRPEQVLEADRRSELADPRAQYKLMCEIKCGATVGSIGVGYEDLCSAEQESGYAKIYIPCYEKDKILVFAMGSGESMVDYEYDVVGDGD